MSKFAILVDSTAVVSKEVFDNNSNLYSVPLKVLIGDDAYSDGIDLTQQLFFETLKEKKDLPTTSQPAVGDVSVMLEKLIQEYEHVFYITISSKISGTYQTGEMLKQQIDSSKITVFDSGFTSVVQNVMIDQTLEMIRNNDSVEKIQTSLNYMRDNSNVLLVVDDLKHLQRTGRISYTAASIGTTLKIKPILHFEEGSIVIRKKIRTLKKAHSKLIEIIEEENLSKNSVIAIAHADGLEYAEMVKSELKNKYPNHTVLIHELSPVISVHTGAGTIGLGWVNTK